MIPRVLKRSLPRVAEHAERNGWTVVGVNGRGHYRLQHDATGLHVTAAKSPSDYRADKNTVAWMRRIEEGRDHGRNRSPRRGGKAATTD